MDETSVRQQMAFAFKISQLRCKPVLFGFKFFVNIPPNEVMPHKAKLLFF